MHRILLSLPLLALICLSAALAAQQAPPAPDSAATIRATADLVVVDVTVRDAKQNPVKHLAQSQFTVLEDGHPQTIKFFEEHVAPPATQAAAALDAMPKLPPGLFTNFTVAPASGALSILLIDKLNTPMVQQAILRQQVLKYLADMPAGTRMAIFVLTSRLNMVQGFTSDPAVLRAAIAGIDGKPKASPLINKPVSGDIAGGDNLDLSSLESALAAGGAQFAVEGLQQLEADVTAAQTQHSEDYTLDALNLLAHYLVGLPGRKNLIWLSGSFPISILPVPGARNDFSATGAYTREYREMVDLFARSQVAVYPVDISGLTGPPTLSADKAEPDLRGGILAAYEAQRADVHDNMNQMAEATGGRAFAYTNDLGGAIGSAIESGSDYYTLAYTPTNRNQNGRYRNIDVKLADPGVTLAYRRGYYADDSQKSAQQSAQQSDAQYSPVRAAMEHGAPDPTELIFVAGVRPNTNKVETSLAKGNQASKNFTGPYRSYTVTFSTRAGDFECPAGPDGAHHCTITFLTCVYDANGTPLNTQTDGINVSIPADQYAEAPHRNFVHHQQISVPAKGMYFLRMGIRDDDSGKLGAFEIPVAAVASLPPLNGTNVAPTPAAFSK